MADSRSVKVLGPRSGSTSSLRSTSTTSSATSSTSSGGRSLGEKKTGRSASPEPGGKLPKEGASKPKKEPVSAKAQSRKKRESAQDDLIVLPEGTPYAKLGRLKDAGNPKKEAALVVEKLKLCCTVYDFTTDAQQPEKQGKMLTLMEVLERWNGAEKDKKDKEKDKSKKKDKGKDKKKEETGNSSIGSSGDESMVSPELAEAVIDLVKANAFRDLCARKERTPMDLLDGEDEEPLLELTWPHLELVYEVLLKFLSCKDLDVSMAQSAGLDKAFLHTLLGLFESEDPRERESLKSILTKLFNRISPLRSSIRRGIQAFCLRAVYLDGDEAPVCGVAEVLDVLGGRVIGGFSTPLKDEHRDLLLKVLLPLYKLDILMFYHSQLKDLVRTFCKKEPSLAKSVILALLRYWPTLAAAKQTIFLAELEDMINILPNAEFKSVSDSVAIRIANCVSCPNSEVAEKGLSIWRNEKMVRLFVQNCRAQMPGIVSALYGNITQSWNGAVLNKTIEVLRNFMEADSEIFDSSSGKHRKDKDEEDKREELRAKRWTHLQQLHDKKMATNLGSVAWQPLADDGADGRGSVAKPLIATQRVQLQADSSCAVALCWDQAARQHQKRMSLQALLVSTDGKIMDAVHERNISALRSAVRLTNRIPKSSNGKSSCCGTIWATLDMLPASVAMLIYVVTTDDGSCIDDVARNPVLIVDLAGGNPLGEINITPPPGSVAGPVAVIQRLEWGGWTFTPKKEFTNSSSHFMGFPEHILGKVVKDALPLVPKRQKIGASFQILDKGSVADFPSLSGGRTRSVFVGMGWDFSPAAGEETVKVDVALLLCDADGGLIGTVSSGNPEAIKGAFHTGDGSLSAGVFVELDSLSEEVSIAFVVAHLVSVDSTLELLQQPHCTVIDCAGKELARYSMPEEDKQLGQDQTGMIMARIFWNQFQERWNFQGLGAFCTGRHWKDSLPAVASFAHKRPRELQTLAFLDEDLFRKGRACRAEVVSL